MATVAVSCKASSKPSPGARRFTASTSGIECSAVLRWNKRASWLGSPPPSRAISGRGSTGNSRVFAQADEWASPGGCQRTCSSQGGAHMLRALVPRLALGLSLLLAPALAAQLPDPEPGEDKPTPWTDDDAGTTTDPSLPFEQWTLGDDLLPYDGDPLSLDSEDLYA